MLTNKHTLILVACIFLAACGKNENAGSANTSKDTKDTVNAGFLGYSRKKVDDVSVYYKFPDRYNDAEYSELAKRYVQAYAMVENNDEVAARMTVAGYSQIADAFKRQDVIKANRSAFDQLYANKDGKIAVTSGKAILSPYDFSKKAFPFSLSADLKDGVIYSLTNYGSGVISVQGVPVLGQTSNEKEPWIYRPQNEDEARQIEANITSKRGSATSPAFVDQVFYGRVVKAYLASGETPNLVIVPDRVDLVNNGKVLFSINAKELEEAQSRAEKEAGSYNVVDDDVAKILGVKK